jgi:hypothetical protein
VFGWGLESLRSRAWRPFPPDSVSWRGARRSDVDGSNFRRRCLARPGVAVRVALVPSLDRLAWLLGAAGVVVVATTFATWGRPVRIIPAARIGAPLGFLAFWAIPYLLRLADHLPLLLVLAGPGRWIIAAAAVGWAGTRPVFVVSLCLFVASGWHVKRVLGFGGDEPHYLMIAQSLLSDGDLLVIPLDLPARLSHVWVGASDGAVVRNVTRVEAQALTPRGARPATSRVYAAGALESRPGRYDFFMDRFTYPESGAFWVRGEREGQVLVSPGGARTIELLLGNGATTGHVIVGAPGLMRLC